MTYASGGLIEALDYNNFVASVNAIWGVGSGNSGYGGANLGNVNVSGAEIVTAVQWNTLISRLDSITNHQAGTGSGITARVAGNVITYLSTITSSISTLTTNRLNAATNSTGYQGSTVSNSTGWTTTAVKEVSLTWPNANAMRYYFNAGGYVTFDCDHTGTVLTGNTKSTDWDALITAAGTIRINANSSAKVAGSGTQTINNTALGFYQMPSGATWPIAPNTAAVISRQYSTTATGGYTSNFITYEARINAAAGSSTTMFLRATLSDGSADIANDTVSGALIMRYAVTPPEVTHIANTWGTITANNAVTNTQV
jgi:hypothetical protein